MAATVDVPMERGILIEPLRADVQTVNPLMKMKNLFRTRSPDLGWEAQAPQLPDIFADRFELARWTDPRLLKPGRERWSRSPWGLGRHAFWRHGEGSEPSANDWCERSGQSVRAGRGAAGHGYRGV